MIWFCPDSNGEGLRCELFDDHGGAHYFAASATPMEERSALAVEFGPFEWATLAPVVTLQMYLEGIRDRHRLLAAMSEAMGARDHEDTCSHALNPEYLCNCWRSFFEPYTSTRGTDA